MNSKSTTDRFLNTPRGAAIVADAEAEAARAKRARRLELATALRDADAAALPVIRRHEKAINEASAEVAAAETRLRMARESVAAAVNAKAVAVFPLNAERDARFNEIEGLVPESVEKFVADANGLLNRLHESRAKRVVRNDFGYEVAVASNDAGISAAITIVRDLIEQAKALTFEPIPDASIADRCDTLRRQFPNPDEIKLVDLPREQGR